jgi:hypothetical protein
MNVDQVGENLEETKVRCFMQTFTEREKVSNLGGGYFVVVVQDWLNWRLLLLAA